MNTPSVWIRIPLAAIAISAVAALIVTVIGLIDRWNMVDYSNGMFISGGVAIVFAILSAAGGWRNRADFGQIYSQSAGDMSLVERSKLWVGDITRGYNAFLLMSLVGGLLIGFSILLGSFLD